MKKVAVVVLASVLLIMIAANAPVMAIGPFGALQNENPKFAVDPFGALQMSRGEAGGYITWAFQTEGENDYWMIWQWYDANNGKGKAENALSFTLPMLAQFAADEEAYGNGEPVSDNMNVWIFVDPNVKMYHSGTNIMHGMVWWFYYFLSGGKVEVANRLEAQYPNGAFWKYNFIG